MKAIDARKLLESVPDDTEIVMLGESNPYSGSRDCISVRLVVSHAHKMATGTLSMPAKGSEKYYNEWQKMPIILVT